MKEQTIYLVMDDRRHVRKVFAHYAAAKEWADLGQYIVVPWDMIL